MQTFSRSMAVVLLAAIMAAPAYAEVSELRISKQPGLVYLPMIVMEQNKLIEKQAKQRGLGDLKVSWTTLNSGGTAVDALLSNNIDLVTSGATNLLVAWSATGGQVKGVAGVSTLPMFLVTTNPNVKTIKDFTAGDKIAVPTVKVSTQATILQMAAEKQLGEAETHKLDPLTVALGHPDAYIALKSGGGAVNSHFSLPPYMYEELKIPGVHVVLNSVDVVPGPISNGVVFGTVKFHDANPKTMAAFHAALNEAFEMIAKDKKAAAQTYLAATNEKWPLDDLVTMLNDKNFGYSGAPKASMKLADLMYRAGNIKTKANSWKDYFFPEVYGLPGS